MKLLTRRQFDQLLEQNDYKQEFVEIETRTEPWFDGEKEVIRTVESGYFIKYVEQKDIKYKYYQGYQKDLTNDDTLEIFGLENQVTSILENAKFVDRNGDELPDDAFEDLLPQSFKQLDTEPA